MNMFKWVDKLNKALGMLGATLVIVLMLAMLYEVVARYAFNAPTLWSGVVSKIIQVALGFLVAGYVLFVEGHLAMEILTQRVSTTTRNWLLAVTSALGCLFCGVEAYFSWDLVATSWRFGSRLLDLHEIPLFPIQLLTVIGFVIFGLAFMSRCHRYLLAALMRKK
jgi:TRAP-type C4-dicarboxylate transport system permease small subunit